MNFEQDFATVDIIIESSFETRGVDAFILSLIKAEKQMRRIFTFLIFQSPSFNNGQYSDLRRILASNKKIYFQGFINGVNLILPRQLIEIYGDHYESDITDLLNFANDRNKIFHGQITENGLTREDLMSRVSHIKKWCKNLAEKLSDEIGYDGFSESFIKSNINLNLNNLQMFDTLNKYEEFLKNELQRKLIK